MRFRLRVVESTVCWLAVWGTAVLSGVAWSPVRGAGPRYQVGAAKVDITPDFPVRLAGYGNRRDEVAKVAQPISARAIAITDRTGKQSVIFVNVEVCGFSAPWADSIAARITKETGVPRSGIAICATHSHTSPWVVGFAPFISLTPLPPDHRAHMERYTRELADRLVEVARRAYRGRVPASLKWGRGKVGFAVNRRKMQSGKWAGFGETPDGPVDHRLNLLLAEDAAGKPVAVLANYACHCTTLGGDFMQIAGDWAGFAHRLLEEHFPGAVSMVIIGCGADANPTPRGKFEYCRPQGKELADEALRVAKGGLKPVTGPIRCRFDRVDVPLAPLPSKEDWEAERKAGGARAMRAAYFLQRMAAGKPIPDHVPLTVATWTFGESLGFVFLAGEVVVDYALRFDREFDTSRLWITAYANDVPCYIPSKRILKEGGYEADSSMVYYGKPTRFDPAIEDLLTDTVQRLLPHAFYTRAKQRDLPPPKTPDESRRSIRLPNELQVELVAAEPLIVDPVAFDWGPDGRLWVVEMRDYPSGMDGRGRPGGRVKVLTDRDGDGRYDEASVFLDDIPFPTGVKVWRDGVLITAAPNIIYAEDRDGDGRADLRRTLYAGFGTGNQQHRVNGLRYGLDNWLYVGNGQSHGKVRSEVTGRVVSVSGRDLRIRPDTGELEDQSGATQFGRSMNDWGDWFGGSNSLPCWHYVLDEHYLRRNPHLRSGSTRRDICVPPGAAPVYPASRTLTRFNDFDKVDRFTSACSPMFFGSHLLGDEYDGNLFVCEPVHNLVYRGIVRPVGYSFRATRGPREAASEFLASTDNWSRFAMVRTGPDGALWIADMYRFVIEHPEWIPMRWQRKLDVRAGDDAGRIYRIVPRGKTIGAVPRLDRLDPKQLVERLGDANRQIRLMAQQLLLWHKDVSVVPGLRDMVRHDARPLGRLHALYTLDGLEALDDATLLAALHDTKPGVVRHAVRLAEPRLDRNPKLLAAVVRLVDTPSPRLRQQLAYSLGAAKQGAAARALGDLLAAHGDDPILRTSALSSLHAHNVKAVVETVYARRAGQRGSSALLIELLQQSIAFGAKEATSQYYARFVERPGADRVKRFEDVARFLDAFAAMRVSWETRLAPPMRGEIEATIAGARKEIAAEGRDERFTLAAMRLLGRQQAARLDDLKRLGRLLRPQLSQRVQQAAILRLAATGDRNVGSVLLDAWRQLSPARREDVLDVLFSRKTWTSQLLAAIESGRVGPNDLSAARESMLRHHHDAELRRRAEKVLRTTRDDRREVVQRYLDALANRHGDAVRGKSVFAKRCASCHRLEDAGHAVGADLLALTDRSTPFLVTAILDPNRAVEDRFQSYVVATTDGRVLSGLLADETGNSLVLLDQDAKRHEVLRRDVDEIAATGKSLMPEGLEKDLSEQDLADVIAYLQQFDWTPKSFPGNHPQVAPVRDDGSIRMLAIHARIYGPSLVFEEGHRNLGYWQSERDVAAWDVELIRSGTYNVYIEYASPPSAAGDRFVLRLQGKSLAGTVASTGGWDSYGMRLIGKMELAAGKTEATLRSDGPIHSALFDVRSVRLIPVEP